MIFLLVLWVLVDLTAVSWGADSILTETREASYRYRDYYGNYDGTNGPNGNNDDTDRPFIITVYDIDVLSPSNDEALTSVLEGSPVGTVVTWLSITSEDPVECLLSDDTETFELVPFETGYNLRTTEALDREANPSYILYVVCSTDDSPPVRVMKKLKVSILDINDNTPMFTPDYFEVSIPEDSPVNSELISIRAVDYDSDDEGDLSYGIPDSQGLVRISLNNVHGIVYTTALLDREKIDSFSFHVVVTDNGYPRRTGSCTVNVTITDVNDARPVFSVDPFYFVVDRTRGVGTEVGLISAVDPDAPPNNAFVFELFPSYAKFAIDSDSGRITVKEDLAQQSRALHHLTVLARDVEPPALTSSADVFVFVVG